MFQVGLFKGYFTHHVQFSLTWSPRVPTFSASTSRFSEFKLLGDRCCSQEKGASPNSCKHGSCPVVPFYGATRHPLTGVLRRILVGIPIVELSCSTELLSAAPSVEPLSRNRCRSPQVRSSSYALCQLGFAQLPLFSEPLS